MHSKHKPVGCFNFKLQREQEGKYFSKPKSHAKRTLNFISQARPKNIYIYKYQSVLERKKRNFPFVVFLCRKP